MDINTKIIDFFQRIQKRIEEAKFPKELEDLITFNDLYAIYTHVFDNKLLYEKELQTKKTIRMGKETTSLARTLNIILDPNTNAFRLLLETKRKNNLNIKNYTLKVFVGSSKSVKPTWAIDGDEPEKMANAVVYINSENDLLITQQEADLVKEIRQKFPDKNLFLSSASLGAQIEKKGVKIENVKENKTSFLREYSYKFSLYSHWANCGDLNDFLHTDEGLFLSIEHKNQMILQLATAVYTLHSLDLIHQDIKLKNILVFRHKEGGYHVELTDFGGLCNPENIDELEILTSAGYESPEISVMNKEQTDEFHQYYYEKDVESYGRKIAENFERNPEYQKPNKANDMWALGIVAHQLYFQSMPKESQAPHFPPLIASLLDRDRSRRLTALEMLEWLQKEKQIIHNSPLMDLKKNISKIKIAVFFLKISDRLKEDTLPKKLNGLIQKQDYIAIFEYILKNEKTLSLALDEGYPIRLAKEQTALARTLNIIFKPDTDEIMLVLETKSKNNINKKIQNAEVYIKNFKTIKIAWRIDTAEPQKLANERLYLGRRIEVVEAMRQVNITTELMKKAKSSNVFLTELSRGELIDKQEKKRKEIDYFKKISHYYAWPDVINLKVFLKSPQALFLSDVALDEMAEQLIRAVKALHDVEMIHQHIKSDNILVYKNAEGKYYLSLGSFGKLYEQNCFASIARREIKIAPLYEPLEICSMRVTSNPELYVPNKATDMWALGVVLFELYYKKQPTWKVVDETESSDLIKGLLQFEREDRFTAQQALLALHLKKTLSLEQKKEVPIEALEMKTARLSFLEPEKKLKPKKTGYWGLLTKKKEKPAKTPL